MRDRMNIKHGTAKRVSLVAGIAVILAVLAACSSSTTNGSNGASSGGTSAAAAVASGGSAASDSSGVAQAQAAVEAAYKGDFTAPPTTGPKAVRGKTVWTVSVGDSTGAGIYTRAEHAAAKILGWTIHSCDGNYDPAKFQSCMDQAVAAHPDGIFDNAIDCDQFKAPLAAAKAAHIPVVMVFAVDCNENLPTPAGPSLATSVIPSTLYPTIPDYWYGIGKLEAEYLVAKTNGNAKLLNLVYTSNVGGYQVDKAIKAVFAQLCPKTCTTYDLPTTEADVNVQNITSIFESGRLRYPQANSFQAFNQIYFELGIDQQLKVRNGLVTVTSGGGDPETGPELSGGTVSAMVAYVDPTWFGYAAADTMNRIFAGQPAVPEGLGLQLLSPGHDVPKVSYAAPIDYRALYAKLWTGQ